MFKRFVTVVLLASAAVAATPTLRLPEDVRPVRYRLDLTLIPEQDTFTGAIDIDLDIQKSTGTVWLNSGGLTLREAKFTVAGRTTAAAIEPGGNDFAGFTLPAAIPIGRARLRVLIVVRAELAEPSGSRIQAGGNASIATPRACAFSSRVGVARNRLADGFPWLRAKCG